MRYFVFALLVLISLQLPAQAAEKPYWSSVVVNLNNELEKAANAYRHSEPKKANRAVIQAYFGIFEGKKVESAMRMELGAQYTYQIEQTFSELRSAIKRKVGSADFNKQINDLMKKLTTDAMKLDKAGIAPSVFNIQE